MSALLYCSVCKRFHTSRPSQKCRDEAARADQPPGKVTAGSMVIVALLVGFMAGQLTNDGVVALGVTLSVLVIYGLFRLF